MTTEEQKPSSKSARIAAKKISDKCKKIRNKRNIDVIEKKKSAQIAAKKISNKYKKMRYKKPPPTFLVDEADIETIGYNDDINFDDVVSTRSATIAANKIKNKYKKMRAKRKTIPFDIDEIEQADAINYVDDVSLDDVRQNKNVIITAKKITDKHKRLSQKRKRSKSHEPIEGPIKKPASGVQSKKSAVMAAKKITDKYKK